MEDIMKMNVPDTTGGAKGRYKIQLFDANTNELLEETECNNMINPAFGTIGYHLFYLQMQFGNEWNIARLLGVENTDGMQSGYCSTLSIVNTDYSPEQHPYGFPDGDTLCKTNLYKTDSNESSVRANINLNESYNRVEFDDSGKMVYRRHIVVDYATHQGNGTFNSIIISQCSLDMFKLMQGHGNANNNYNEYRNKSIGSVPYARINEKNIGTSLSNSSDYGNVSVESAGIFWTCNSAGSFKNPSSSSTQSNNWDNLTFYRWDVTDGTIKLTKTVKLSGTPEDLLNNLGTDYYLVGCYFQGKFYVEITSKSSPYGYTCYIFNSEGVYEKSITWERTSSSSGSVSPGYGYLDYSLGVFVALPQCVIQCRYYDNRGYDTMYLNIFGVDGSPIKQLSRDESQQLIHGLYINAYNSPDYPLSNIDTKRVTFVPFTQPNGKTIAMVCYKGINNQIGYYDPETNDFKPLESKLLWNHDLDVGDIVNGMYVYQNSGYQSTSSGLLVSGAIPWWSWCKLPKSVTKTSSTTMKIQYDIVMDYVPPFSPAITTK